MTRLAELFAFEVPTSMGKFRIIGPDSLTADEASVVAMKIARLLPQLVNELEPEVCTFRGCGKPESDPIHPGPNEPMGDGRHVYRHDTRRVFGDPAAIKRAGV